MSMELADALKVIAEHRGGRVVVTTMSSIAIWHGLSDTPLDFHFIPSAMGHASSLGLGLALAKPEQGCIVLNGDGSTLMNLGSLVTLAQNPAQIFLTILDNGIYEVTGGQAVAGGGRTDFAGLARAAGIKRVYAFTKLDDWRRGAAEALAGKGPVVIVLQIPGRKGQKTPAPPHPMQEQIQRLQGALGS